eukprot:TRINITY_DN7369_c0_g1_i1.p4 TRINITY_DN7369_c0_g1~~TRINITY_DN7369_c0_g1_i1.p4  ORF type:complete len:109 (+),score=15.53 TRINITY_DN7369_c0_g1_i1:616-942(+)
MNYELERATDLLSWRPSRPADFRAGASLVCEPSSLLTCGNYRLSWTMTPSVEIAANSYVAVSFPPDVDVAQATSASLNGLSVDNVNKRIVGTTTVSYTHLTLPTIYSV